MGFRRVGGYMSEDTVDVSERTPFVAEGATYLLLLTGGMLAAGLSLLFFLIGAIRYLPDSQFFPASVLSCAAAGATVLLCYACNDALVARRGWMVHAGAACLLALAGSLLGWYGVFGHAASLASGLALLFLLWGRHLASLSHRMLVIVMSLIMLAMGVAGCMLPSVQSAAHHLALGLLLFLVSVVFFVVVRKVAICGDALPRTLEESKLNEGILKTNYAPALSDGLIAGTVVSLLSMHAGQLAYASLPVGIALIACAALCLLQLTPNFQYELLLRNHAICFKSVPFLFFPLLAYLDQGVFACISLVISLCFGAMLLASLTERIRFMSLSSFYAFGKQGAVFFAGAACGLLLVEASGRMYALGMWEGAVLFCVAVLAIEWSLVGSMRGRATYDHVRAAQSVAAGDGPQVGQRKPSWRDRIDAVSQEYNLSLRQQEVLVHLARGRNAQYIAEHLNITLATAKSHIYNIYIKLGVHTRQELLDVLDSTDA